MMLVVSCLEEVPMFKTELLSWEQITTSIILSPLWMMLVDVCRLVTLIFKSY
jgi:hypothetical protein